MLNDMTCKLPDGSRCTACCETIRIPDEYTIRRQLWDKDPVKFFGKFIATYWIPLDPEYVEQKNPFLYYNIPGLDTIHPDIGDVDPGQDFMYFRCTWLRPWGCGCHLDRPFVCREYPGRRLTTEGKKLLIRTSPEGEYVKGCVEIEKLKKHVQDT